MSQVINFSGWYKVTFHLKTKIKMVMDLDVLDRDIYHIEIELSQPLDDPKNFLLNLEITQTKDFLGTTFGTQRDYRWIPKYMLRPTKWGKEIFSANPDFIKKLWGLVATPSKLNILKNVQTGQMVSVQV